MKGSAYTRELLAFMNLLKSLSSKHIHFPIVKKKSKKSQCGKKNSIPRAGLFDYAWKGVNIGRLIGNDANATLLR